MLAPGIPGVPGRKSRELSLDTGNNGVGVQHPWTTAVTCVSCAVGSLFFASSRIAGSWTVSSSDEAVSSDEENARTSGESSAEESSSPEEAPRRRRRSSKKAKKPSKKKGSKKKTRKRKEVKQEKRHKVPRRPTARATAPTKGRRKVPKRAAEEGSDDGNDESHGTPPQPTADPFVTPYKVRSSFFCPLCQPVRGKWECPPMSVSADNIRINTGKMVLGAAAEKGKAEAEVITYCMSSPVVVLQSNYKHSIVLMDGITVRYIRRDQEIFLRWHEFRGHCGKDVSSKKPSEFLDKYVPLLLEKKRFGRMKALFDVQPIKDDIRDNRANANVDPAVVRFPLLSGARKKCPFTHECERVHAAYKYRTVRGAGACLQDAVFQPEEVHKCVPNLPIVCLSEATEEGELFMHDPTLPFRPALVPDRLQPRAGICMRRAPAHTHG